MGATKKPTFEEWLDCSELAFEWARSYDEKDWDRLARMLAPTVSVNYSGVNNSKSDDMPAASFVEMMRDPLFLGDKHIDSQHMLALSKWEKISNTEIVSQHQSRAAHMRWNEGRETIAAKGHGHGLVKMFYKKINGEWRWGGIATKVDFNEHEFENVFVGSAGKYDKDGKALEANSAEMTL
ncbi:NTF2-like protein [Dothidotthia symphoricarpi CBS 119687]|uniref:NTF2-like protein n=1 Tax=Dothidotthia symphoricarpi CBS 119687 TaxID=1392245 RepID=A0A6A6AKV8_9PLEO|nr:NTF2-like protein [Dothidotthia symphoricarpi CBS 119687]KAF2132460.1 NTF2-like protein [Dothidotthia symphoricarpi CBS 119687]